MAGQIVKRGENRYLVRIYMGLDSNGKRKYHNKTIHGNKKDAERYRNKILREKDMGTFVEPTRDKLSEYLEKWLETVVKNRVREKTLKSYEQLVRIYINPSLGEATLSRLSPEEIQEFYNDMLERGLSPRTIRYTHTVLRNALDQAVKWGKIYRNPSELVDLPRQKKEEMKTLTPEQVSIFMEATIYSPWKALFSLMLASGMRPGETLGLKWADIDLEKGRIHVRRVLTRSGDTWSLEEPKTPQSKRVIPIPRGVVKDLEDHKVDQAEEKLRARNYNDTGLVFADGNGNPLHHRNIVNRHFKPLLKAADLPDIRLYDLRHTCATLLLSAGENPKIVSERLGHASITLTLDTYSHVLPDMQQSASDKLEKVLFNNTHTKENPHTIRTQKKPGSNSQA